MGIFGGGSQSRYAPPDLPATPPAPPTPVDKAAEDAAQQTKARLSASRGMGSTLLTGGQGVSTPAMVGGKTLLGQ